jgi:hypothetical protein
MPRRSFVSSTSRRHRLADKILACGTFVMRSYSYCASSGSACVLSEISEKCSQCHRFDRSCDLASPWPEVHRLLEQRDKLREQRIEAEAKAVRLRKQERQLFKKARALGDRESKMIKELEADERLLDELAPPLTPSAGPSLPAPRVPSSPAGFF